MENRKILKTSPNDCVDLKRSLLPEREFLDEDAEITHEKHSVLSFMISVIGITIFSLLFFI